MTMGVPVGGASIEASPRVFQGGEASDGPSPCESRRQRRGVAEWRASV